MEKERKGLVVDRDKQKLINECSAEITNVFDGALSYIEILLPDDQYARVRSKILRLGNNAIRKLNTEITEHYSVKYDSGMDRIVKVGGGNNEERHKKNVR